jgi:two-component system, cell cycle sensor histidine kinase and response regulator CckA
MAVPLRVLVLEDRPSDARLVIHELQRAGFNPKWERVETEADFLSRLEWTWDLILADYDLPQFDAATALARVRERNLDIPFIIVSGTIGEELAVAAMKEGAADYLLKDRLSRLGPAVNQALAHKRLTDQLRQAQKMEAVGRLAGGVAHDFNNLLTIILGYSEVSLAQLRPGDPLREVFEEIRKAAGRASDLTRQLLAFSRKQVLSPVVLDLNGLLADIERMLRRLIGEDIDLAINVAPRLWPVRADPGQIEQVLMNLVINARDAMPQGGKLTITTADVELDDNYCTMHADARAGQYALLAVSDNGAGIDKQTLAHIFEPFFTTKGPEKGTGLGLATVYGIVKQSGGHVAVYSEPGCGSCFKVYLPRDRETAQETAATATSRSKGQGSETILLVEDEDAVRSLARRVLEAQGYRVLEAKGGSDALLVSQATSEPIHLLATDVVMPQMSGRELAERLTAVRPDLKVLYLSGYMDDAIIRHGLIHADVPFLQKPYSPDSLLQKVREVLDRPHDSG